MTAFRADLHIHSRFSRATSSRLTVPNLAAWAGFKGIQVLGTGDFTHPAWRDELRNGLVLDESSGLYRLKEPLGPEARAAELEGLGGTGHLPLDEPLFMLQAEISSIYKKDGAVRKVHSLVFMPDFASADKLCARLEQVGNLASDGRPILGLDVKHLLEMILDIPGGYMIPAHIWTPWFSLFGSKSGFDSVEECFEDLSSHIFALETGLSSDPDMIRRWSGLDRFRLVSNSDAHSGENLGREATLFTGSPGYAGIFAALRHNAEGYGGTLEFFPEEGKYHLDGHRDCGVVLEPAESARLNNICPVCAKPLTVGVLHRVLALADRDAPPAPGEGFVSLIPLAEVLGELLHCGAKTKKVKERQSALARRFGPELSLLLDTPVKDVGGYWPELGEALARMRRGQVVRHSGFDGQYGVIRLFEAGEMGLSLLDKVPQARKQAAPGPDRVQAAPKAEKIKEEKAEAFTPSQEKALLAGPGPVLVIAGPGAGKTRTLIGRMTRLLSEGVPAGDIVAVTFTRRAAGELNERLAAAVADKRVLLPESDTLHALALRHNPAPEPHVLSEEAARRVFLRACFAGGERGAEIRRKAADVWQRLALARERLEDDPELRPYARAYAAWKKERGLADYTDLLESFLNYLRQGGVRPWKHVLLDEAQDLSPLQQALVAALLPADGSGFFGIGDPDQAIYGFRGAGVDVASGLKRLWPGLEILSLEESHRCAAPILDAGRKVLGERAACAVMRATRAGPATLQWMEAPDVAREAAWVAERVSRLIGGTSHSEADTRRERAGCHLVSGSCGPGDIAVLVRLKALMPPFQNALEKKGIPFSVPEQEAFWADPMAERLLQGAAFFLRGGDNPDDPLLAALPSGAWNTGPGAVIAALARQGTEQEGGDDFSLFAESAAFTRLSRAFREQGGWQALLEFVAFRQEMDLVRARAQKVQLMTIHAAKGLEFKAVFLPCLEEGLLPFAGTDNILAGRRDVDARTLREEERLLYVGLTRAAEALFASRSLRRTLYGRKLELAPSSLLPVSCFFRVNLQKQTKLIASQLSFS